MKQSRDRPFLVMLPCNRADEIEGRTVEPDIVLTTAEHLPARIEHSNPLKSIAFPLEDYSCKVSTKAENRLACRKSMCDCARCLLYDGAPWPRACDQRGQPHAPP